MQNIILTTPEQLEAIVNKCLARYALTPDPEPKSESEAEGERYLYSIRELADFFGCSIVTAQKLKNSGRLRYRQFGRKVVFLASEILEDLSRNHKINKKKA